MFAILEVESIVQVGDRTRLSAVKSFGAEFDSVAITPEEGATPVICTSDMFLDWSYSTEGAKVVTLSVTSGESTKSIPRTLQVVSAETDALYSSDSDLKEVESQIERYLSEGRSSYLDKHRSAKKEILQILKSKEVISRDATDLSGIAIDRVALKDWSRYLVLATIFGEENTGFGVGGESYFKAKSIEYKAKAENASLSVVLGKDSDSDNVADEPIPSGFTCEMVRA